MQAHSLPSLDQRKQKAYQRFLIVYDDQVGRSITVKQANSQPQLYYREYRR